MTSVTIEAGVWGTMEGCVLVSTDSSHNDSADVMYSVVLPPAHHDPRCVDVPYNDVF